jgi:hypothetical protein
VITLLNGEVIMAPQGGLGSIHWECVETDNWLGFRNVASGCYLGHQHERLQCWVKHHKDCEYFCARPKGGYVSLLTGGKRLCRVGTKREDEVERLVKLENGGFDEIAWEFIEVQSPRTL